MQKMIKICAQTLRIVTIFKQIKHMKKFRFLLFILSAILVSCSNLIDEDLGDGYSVTVQSPNDSLVTNSFTVTFWWEEMVEASRYKIQAVHPDFDAVEYVVFDTIITDNSFTY